MNYLQTPVEVRINFGSSPTGPVGATIRVTDRMSNRVIMDLDVSGQDFAELLASRAAYAMADLLPQEHYQKVGMKEEVHKLTNEEYSSAWPAQWRRDTLKDPNNKYGYVAPDYLIEFAQEYVHNNGWDSYEWRYHNYGWDMIVRRHVESTEEERQARLDPHNW